MLGSPPHTRGKVGDAISGFLELRITPAYAGKSCAKVYFYCWVEDHPRIRGEKWLEGFSTFSIYGSPPHTRGKEMISGLYERDLGITPAYAGKSRP